MDQQEPQSPLSEQRHQVEQNTYGWQYAGEESPPQNVQSLPSQSGLAPSSLPGISGLPTRTPSGGSSLLRSQPALPPLPTESSSLQDLPDMGTSLKYGQSMEYQYFDAPQPSQPIARLREDRLQRLREERLHRQHGGGAMSQGDTAIPRFSRWLSGSVIQPTMKTLQNSSSGVSVPDQPTTDMPVPGTDNVAKAGGQDTGAMQRIRLRNAALILTGAFVASRILGLLRTSLFAFVFATSSTSDAYLQAFLIPELIFNLVTGGALLSAFIPVFTHYTTGENDERTAWHLTSTVLNLAILGMSALALFALIFAPALVPLYNPGLQNSEHLDLITNLTRIMLLQAILLGAGSVVTSVLNARQAFRAPAIGTVLYNVGLIVGLLPGVVFVVTGAHNDTVAIYAATWGVVLGAALQVAIQVPGLIRAGLHYTFALDWRHPGVIQIARQMVPRTLNASMLYISIFVDRGLIQLLIVMLGIASVDGLITQYYQAFQLVLLPLGIFGMAMSTAAFPTLAENVARNRLDRVRATILTTLRSILFLSIPSTIGLIVLGLPIVQAVLQHGRYTLQEAQSTAVPLACFAFGLTGLAAVEILSRSFYALRDSVTPVVISIAQFGIKIVLALLLINVAVWWGPAWGLGALALSTSLAGLLEAGILFHLLQRRAGKMPVRELGLFIVRVLVAAAVMGVCLFVLRLILDLLLVTTSQQQTSLVSELLAVLKLLIELAVGLFVYIRVARFLNIEELAPLKRILERLHLSWI